MFENIYSSTQLKTNLREVKDAAKNGVVHITENGVVAYEFMSVEVYNKLMVRAAREAEWGVMVENAMAWAGEDYERGLAVSIREGVVASPTLMSDLQREGLDLTWPAFSVAVDYIADDPSVGKAVPESVPRKHPYGDDARFFFCDGRDLVYEYDSSGGDVLLCRLVDSLDSFGEEE